MKPVHCSAIAAGQAEVACRAPQGFCGFWRWTFVVFRVVIRQRKLGVRGILPFSLCSAAVEQGTVVKTLTST